MRHLRIFLASPGDVAEERALALQVLEQLQYDPLLRGQITVETVAWDKPGAGAPLLATLTPQQAIAQGLPKPSECDIVIVILWSRLGTPLPPEWTQPDGRRYRSGTEWEYEDARQAAEQHGRTKLLLYRRTEKVLIDLDDPEFDERSRQWRLVKDFFTALRNPDGSIRGGCNEYATPLQFKDDLITHLRALILELAPELRPSWPWGRGRLTPAPRPARRHRPVSELSARPPSVSQPQRHGPVGTGAGGQRPSARGGESPAESLMTLPPWHEDLIGKHHRFFYRE